MFLTLPIEEAKFSPATGFIQTRLKVQQKYPPPPTLDTRLSKNGENLLHSICCQLGEIGISGITYGLKKYA